MSVHSVAHLASSVLCPAMVVLALVAAHTADAETLVTATSTISIRLNCAEGNVSCDDVAFTSTDRRSGRTLRLRGRTLHTLCADGVTPCRFLGYEFARGATRYTVLEEGMLVVRRGGKVLLEQAGQWQP